MSGKNSAILRGVRVVTPSRILDPVTISVQNGLISEVQETLSRQADLGQTDW